MLHYGRRLIGRPSDEVPLARRDWGWMALVVLSGGAILTWLTRPRVAALFDR